MVLVQQFVSHPIEKLLSVLPNLALMLENSALLELFDLDVVYDMYVKADFHMTTGSFFDGLADIIENQIMKHWYDWLNPVKYAQLLITNACLCRTANPARRCDADLQPYSAQRHCHVLLH